MSTIRSDRVDESRFLHIHPFEDDPLSFCWRSLPDADPCLVDFLHVQHFPVIDREG